MLSQATLKQTPLYSQHLDLKARIVPFAGWQMPVQYEGILNEYEQCRKSVALFDTCHMGEFTVEGDLRQSGLDYLVTQKLDDMPVKGCRYGVTLNEEGGIMDDLIAYRVAAEKWMIVANGGTIEKDERQFLAHLNKEAAFKNISYETGKLDIQGPLSREVLKEFIPGIEKLEYYTFDYFDVLGLMCIVSRTGYTGELGYEIYFPWEKIPQLWKKILKDKRVKPAGLGARDVLRLEMGYSLYGQDLDETVSPLESGLARFVDFKKDFLGKAALLKEKSEGIKRKTVFFASDNRRSPRHNQKLYLQDSTEIGNVTSGTFSPSLKKGIGMGLVEGRHNFEDKKILFGDEENKVVAEITARPFYRHGSLKD